LIGIGANFAAEDARSSGRWLMKAEQGMYQRGLAGAVWSQQANRAPAQITV
jgi:hypothetical protein